MLKFRQWLNEVSRDPQRAAKLGDYLAKREARRNPPSEGQSKSPRFHLPAWHKIGTNNKDLETSDHDDKHFSAAWTNAHRVFSKRKKNIVDVPVKDLLSRNWQGIDFSGKYALTAKDHGFQDRRPINVARSRQSGKLEMVDGFHRLANNWLQGRQTIKANLQDVGRSKFVTKKKS